MTAHDFHQRLRRFQRRMLWHIGGMVLAFMGFLALIKWIVDEPSPAGPFWCKVTNAAIALGMLGLLIFWISLWAKRNRARLGLNCPNCQNTLLKRKRSRDNTPGMETLFTGACPNCHEKVLSELWPPPVYHDPATGSPMETGEALQRWHEMNRRSTPWGWVGFAIALAGMSILQHTGTSLIEGGQAVYGNLLKLAGIAFLPGTIVCGALYLHRRFKALGLVCPKCGVIPHKAGSSALYCLTCVRAGRIHDGDPPPPA